ncbi:MAG: VCBS repeat-containing protein [Candidatus Aminicenantes bacterium]|nr:MAG: VCBS repeat-containing protein [Candidatus Aminicenantes bacterium]
MSDGAGNNIRVLIQNADGTFTPNNYDAGGFPADLAIGNLNGDTLNDVVVSYGGNKPSSFVSVLTQNFGGTLDAAVPYPVYDIPGHILAGDANRDGWDDVIVLHNGWTLFGLLLQNTVTDILDNEELYGIPYASWYKGLNFGDINSDGYADVLASGGYYLIISYGWDQTPGLIVKYPADGSSYNVNSSVGISWGSYNCIVRVTNSAGGLEAHSGKFSITDDGVDIPVRSNLPLPMLPTHHKSFMSP